MLASSWQIQFRLLHNKYVISKLYIFVSKEDRFDLEIFEVRSLKIKFQEDVEEGVTHPLNLRTFFGDRIMFHYLIDYLFD